LAISKEHKKEMLDQYSEWLESSKALFLAEYTGMSMKQMDSLRGKLRELGGEFHIIKNTIGQRAFHKAGYEVPEGYFEGSTAVVFAFEDPPATAKVVVDLTKDVETLKVKGGYLGSQAISAENVRSLADMPPLPVMRAQILGTLMAPANKLVRTLAEPGRQIAAVLQAYAEAEAGEAAAA
jgi:large subunit ribosomal protein L10